MFQALKNLFKRKKEIISSLPQFSFCESITANAVSPWHIRKLSENGLKLGGGCDTVALCGRVVAWDLRTSLNETYLSHCCQICAKLFGERTDEVS
jgi:hypothetical protein